MRGKIMVWVAAIAVMGLGTSSRALGDEAPEARKYCQWLMTAVKDIGTDMPQITQAADAAAKEFVEGKNLGVRGGAGLAGELGGRAGGLMSYHGSEGQGGDIIIYALGVTTHEQPDPAKVLDTELSDAAKLKAGGSLVIAIASVAQLDQLKLHDRAKTSCTFVLDNHAPAGDGLFERDHKPIIPTFTTANPIVAWTWCAEFFAACTRQGKTPTMYQSVYRDRNQARAHKYQDQRFHDDLHCPAIKAGALGKAYLRGLAHVLDDIGTDSWPFVAQTSERMAGTIMDGGKVYIYANGHYPPSHHGGQLAADPGLFIRLNDRNNHFLVDPGLGDYVFAIGYCDPPGTEAWGKPEVLRHGERGVTYVISTYLTRRSDLLPNELVIDQQWNEGDALVKAPGYDIRICPASAVTSEAVMWMVTAQVEDRVAEQRHATVHRK